MIIQLSGEIRGDQLVDEIQQAVGIDVSQAYHFNPPDQVEIIGFDQYQAQIEAVVATHVPQAEYFQSEIDAAALREAIKATAQSAVGETLDNLTQAQLKALVAILLWKAGAVANDLTILPLGQWVRE